MIKPLLTKQSGSLTCRRMSLVRKAPHRVCACAAAGIQPARVAELSICRTNQAAVRTEAGRGLGVGQIGLEALAQILDLLGFGKAAGKPDDDGEQPSLIVLRTS